MREVCECIHRGAERKGVAGKVKRRRKFLDYYYDDDNIEKEWVNTWVRWVKKDWGYKCLHK